jgi:endonuclease/exonuclease/phosphatase family metal-dependent hydrolase
MDRLHPAGPRLAAPRRTPHFPEDRRVVVVVSGRINDHAVAGRRAFPSLSVPGAPNTMTKIISWNLLRLVGASLDDVIALIGRKRPDLLLMQEVTHDIDRLPDRIGGHYARNPLPGRIHGLGVWSRKPLPEPPQVLPLPSGAMFHRVCQIIDLGDFAVANVHLSHGQVLNRRQLRRIARNMPPRAAVLGDFNLVGPALLPGFRDVGPRQHTHFAGEIVPLRIDRCLVRGLTCRGAEALARESSDHRPIVVTLDVAQELKAAA